MYTKSLNTKNSNFTIQKIWIVFAVCLAILAGTYNNLFSYVALALSAFALVILSEEDIIAFLMFLMPFANIFKASPESQSFFTYLILLYVLICVFKNPRLHNKFLFTFLLLFAFLMTQTIIIFNLMRVIKFLVNILFIYFALNAYSTSNSNRIFIFYILGILISSAIAALQIIPNLSNYVEAEELLIEYEQFYRFTGLYSDPNYYSINVIIALCLIVVLNHNKALKNIWAIALSVVMVLFVSMTLSKSAFAMLVLPLILLFYSKIKKKKYFVFISLVTLSVVLMQEIFFKDGGIFDLTLRRFDSATDLTTLTTGRYKLWVTYVEFLCSDFKMMLFGGGFGAELIEKRASHNTYIDLIYYLGIIGTVILLSVFGVLLNLKKNTKKANLLNYSVWICMAIMYFFLSELFYYDWAFHVIIATYISKLNMSRVNEEK